MSELTLESGIDTRQVTVSGKAILAAAPESLSAAIPGSNEEFYSPFGSPRQNSRVGRALPKGVWQLRWKAPLNPEFSPRFLIEARQRILVQSGEWRLFDLDGKLLHQDRAAGAPMITDSAQGRFYGVNPNAYLVGQQLSGGALQFRFLPAYGDIFTRIHLAANGRRMLIAGVERALDPHRQHPPTRSLIEIKDLGNPPRADDLGFLSGAVPVGTLIIPVPKLVVASSPDLIMAATTNWIYPVKWDLQVEAGFQGNFNPQAISLDEKDRSYLVVANVAENGGRSSLWLLKPSGERLYSFDLPGAAALATPPIVGYDHTAYVLTGGQVIAIGQDGKQRWSKTAGGIAGAVVTADNILVVTEGTTLAAYDAGGNRTELVHGESFLTPPLLTASGDLLVASKTTLYCYSAR